MRVKGRPAESATFPNRKEAEAWAASLETAIREGRHFPHAAAERTSFDALAKDYAETVLAEFDEVQRDVWSTDALYRAEAIARGAPGVTGIVDQMQLERDGTSGANSEY